MIHKWYRVRLRLLGDSLPVDSIQEKLQLVPSRIGRKGEYKNENPQSPKYKTNLWVSSYLTSSDVPFEKQIGLLLDILESNIESLREILSLPNVEGNLFLGFSSSNGLGEYYFSHHLCQRIVNCGLSVTLDLYPPCVIYLPHLLKKRLRDEIKGMENGEWGMEEPPTRG